MCVCVCVCVCMCVCVCARIVYMYVYIYIYRCFGRWRLQRRRRMRERFQRRRPAPSPFRARGGRGEKGKEREGWRQGEKVPKRRKPAGGIAGDGEDNISLLSDDDEGRSEGWECKACTSSTPRPARRRAQCALSAGLRAGSGLRLPAGQERRGERRAAVELPQVHAQEPRQRRCLRRL